jgi:carbon-monoxide dehydrogenase large subunit
MAYIGQRALRKEDYHILMGRSRYVADMKLPGMLYAKVLRSPFAHARIRSIDKRAAERLEGVVAVLTGEDVKEKLAYWGQIGTGWSVGDRRALTIDKVHFVGDEVAVVAAENQYAAMDALELIEVDYEELPVYIDPEKAMQPGAELIHPELVEQKIIESNILSRYKLRAGDISKAEKEADLIVSGRFYSNRPVCNALEPHGVLANYDPYLDKLTVWSSTQVAHLVRDGLSEVLRYPANNIHVMVGDMGGGFGSKAELFAHEVLASYLSLITKRPVSLILDRTEVFQACTSRCAQIHYAELMLKKDGTFIGYRSKIVQDQGGYASWGTQVIQIGTHVGGMIPYRFPNVWVDGVDVYTNKNPGGAYRAFGVPQASYVRDSLLHMAAVKLGVPPEELMLKNTVKGSECPCTMSCGHVIDSTGIDACIEKVREEVKRLGWQKNRKPYQGIGWSCTLKHSSCRHPQIDTDYDSVRVRIEPDGTVTVFTSACPHGQGLETTLGQICADQVGVSLDKVRVIGNDSQGPHGLGTWGSRTITITGSALKRAGDVIREKLFKIAAFKLEVGEGDLQIADNWISVKGVPSKKISVQDVAILSHFHTHDLPPGMEAGPIETTQSYDSPTTRLDENGRGNMVVSYNGAAHAALIQVDPGTGKVDILDYVMADDSGVVINPLIVEGQHQGSVPFGLGQALGEDLIYDENGQLLNGNYRDYYIPLATDVPDLSKFYDCGVPSRITPLGQKGAGESGNVPPLAIIANAVEDATGVRITELPVTPDKVLLGIKKAKNARVGSKGSRL